MASYKAAREDFGILSKFEINLFRFRDMSLFRIRRVESKAVSYVSSDYFGKAQNQFVSV